METSYNSPIERLVDAVNGLGGPLATIACHAARWDAAGLSAPDAPPPEETMRMLLAGTLEPLRDEMATADLEAAARVLERVTDEVCSEILLVDPSFITGEPCDEPLPPLRRWARGGGRPRGRRRGR